MVYLVTTSPRVWILQWDIAIDSNQTGSINVIKYKRC